LAPRSVEFGLIASSPITFPTALVDTICEFLGPVLLGNPQVMQVANIGLGLAVASQWHIAVLDRSRAMMFVNTAIGKYTCHAEQSNRYIGERSFAG
jgi:hypothetical protein